MSRGEVIPTLWMDSWQNGKKEVLSQPMSTLEMETPDRKVPEDNFGNRLRLVRAESGLSAEQLATLCGVTDRAYYMWERGGRCRAMDRVVNAICEATGYDRYWLMFGGTLSPPKSRWCQSTGRSDYVELAFDFDAYDFPTSDDHDITSPVARSVHAA